MQDYDDRVRWLGEIEAGRRDRSIPIARLCRDASINRQHYHDMLKGERGPSHPILTRLADALDRLSRAAPAAPTPAPADRIFASGQDYGVIADAARARRNDLKLTVEEVDALAGFAQGHTSKLENWTSPGGRGIGEATVRPWLQALGLTIEVREAPPALQTMRFINRIPADVLSRRVSAGAKVAREIAAKREQA